MDPPSCVLAFGDGGGFWFNACSWILVNGVCGTTNFCISLALGSCEVYLSTSRVMMKPLGFASIRCNTAFALNFCWANINAKCKLELNTRFRIFQNVSNQISYPESFSIGVIGKRSLNISIDYRLILVHQLISQEFHPSLWWRGL